MNTIYIRKFIFKFLITVSAFVCLIGCNELLEPDFPNELYMDQEMVFTTIDNAEGAVRGMYQQMITIGHPFSTNINRGITIFAAMSADELMYLQNDDIELVQIHTNMLLADNGKIEEVWGGLYQSIYTANLLYENLSSASLDHALIAKWKGETLFVRAISYFYLVNIFGDVPLTLSSNYKENSNIPRTPLSEIYDQIVADLQDAIELLPDNYAEERTRPIKATAKALLARVYLYRENWQAAADLATEIIDNTSLYELVALHQIVEAGNREALWQLHISKPLTTNPVTGEGTAFLSNTAIFRQNTQLSETLINAFEPGDLRREQWVSEYLPEVYLPYKYKRGNTTDPGSLEFSTMMRLAEIYLIRAEAYAHLNQNAEAISDLDALRGRAGLPLLAETQPSLSGEALLQQILQERQTELFTEWGHRWLDLKRTGKALEVLSPIKPGIDKNDLLWPIPQLEINNNPALRGHQNPEY